MSGLGLRNVLIDEGTFIRLRKAALKTENWEENKEKDILKFEKAVLQRLRKKRSLKKYKKQGIKKADLQEIIQLADIVSLEIFNGPSNWELSQSLTTSCNHCAKCCTESSPIFIHRDELKPILTLNPELEFEITNNEFYKGHYQFKEDKPCKFHNPQKKKCLIYNTRPQVCRNYPLMLIGEQGKEHYIVNLRYNCNYAITLILEKAIILFDWAIGKVKIGQ